MMHQTIRFRIWLALAATLTLAVAAGARVPDYKPLVRGSLVEDEKSLPAGAIIEARMHDAGFPQAEANYKNLYVAPDGRVYYILSCLQPGVYARMFRYDPAADAVTQLGDMGDVTHENKLRTFPQGKSHVDIFELGGKLYTALTAGFFKPAEEIGATSETAGYQPYPGGHIISFDPANGRFEDLSRAPEGIITFAMDAARKRFYGITTPDGNFITFDLTTKKLQDLGDKFATGCRTLAVDPPTGDVYWTDGGDFFAYRLATNSLEKVPGVDFRDPKLGGDGASWRSIVWYPKEQVFYGIANDGVMLFRFDPRAKRVETLESLAVDAARKAGLDSNLGRCSHGGLGFRLGPDGETIYYAASGPGLNLADGRRIESTLHLVTYHIPTRSYRDHGPLRLNDGRYPTYAQSIYVDGARARIYVVAWINVANDGSPRSKKIIEAQHWTPGSDLPLTEMNLVSFANPLAAAGAAK